MKIFKNLVIIISFLSICRVYAEPATATLSGFIFDSINNETIIGATIALTGTKLGAYSNKNGYFTVSNIPAGVYPVQVRMVGYETIFDTLKFTTGEQKKKNYTLRIKSIESEEVVITAEREDKREISISKINIPVAQLKNIRIGGESDVFRSLQFLPGVLTSSQISSGLFVRGGSPDQNLVLLDGSTVYNPSHLFGFISTFNTDAIKDVELIKGGFPAEYGGRLSAALILTQKDGNSKEIEGKANIGVISSSASVEGPLLNGSFFVAGRRTYLELIKAFITEDPESPLPDFNFYDINAKITQNFGDDDKIFASGFASADNLSYNSFGVDMNLSISNILGSLRWNHVFSPGLFSTINLSGSNYTNNFNGSQSGYEFLINNSITDYTIKQKTEWFVSDITTATFGIEISNLIFKYLQNFTGDTDTTKDGGAGTINMQVEDWNYSVYSQINHYLNPALSIQGGIRVSYWNLANSILFDPRAAIRWQISEKIAAKASFGVFHQNLRLAAMPDFSFFDTWLPTDSTVAISRAFHYIFSLETYPANDLILNFDIYYKKLSGINEINVNSLNQQSANTVSDVFYVGKGYSYGAEIFLQKSSGRMTGWIGYALGWIYAQFDELNNGAEFRPKYDRLHDLKIVAQYKINDDWDVGASFTFQSGQSYTGATSRFQVLFPEMNYGRGKIIPSQRYGLRLPPSHQLNINASYSFKSFGLKSKLTLDIYNVYNRRDIWFRYYNTTQPNTTVEDVRLLPILPTISYEINF